MLTPPKLIYIWPLGPEDKTPRCGIDVPCPCQDRVSDGRGGRATEEDGKIISAEKELILLSKHFSGDRTAPQELIKSYGSGILPPICSVLPPFTSGEISFFSFTVYIMANGYRIRAGVPNLRAVDMYRPETC